MTIAAHRQRVINQIIIHHTATEDGREIAPSQIDDWHRARGFLRTDQPAKWWLPHLTSIGYHHIIGRGGQIWPGRHPDERGAHALGNNSDSIGICLVGMSKFTRPQWAALSLICDAYRRDIPGLRIIGHMDAPGAATECPGFDVRDWLASGPILAHIWPTNTPTGA